MIKKEFDDLKHYLETLECHFLTDLLKKAMVMPEECDLPVRAYCVLSHAAFEEFFERVASKIMDTSIEKWKNTGTVTRPLILLIKLCPETFKIDYENDNDQKKGFDFVKDYLERSKKWFSKVIEENHGISLKYMKRMFYPLFIDINSEPRFRSSLTQLANFRGDFAHKKFAKKIPDPKEAKQFVSDILAFSETLKAIAEGLVNESGHAVTTTN